MKKFLCHRALALFLPVLMLSALAEASVTFAGHDANSPVPCSVTFMATDSAETVAVVSHGSGARLKNWRVRFQESEFVQASRKGHYHHETQQQKFRKSLRKADFEFDARAELKKLKFSDRPESGSVPTDFTCLELAAQ